MKVKAGDVLTFKGCCWHDGWEFDAPLVVYEPIKRYFETGSVCPVAIADKVDDICIDLCVDGDVREDWLPGDLKEFKWRGWNPRGFRSRRGACHAEVTVRFSENEERARGLSFDIIAAASRDIRTGKLTPIFDGVPVTA